MGWFTACEVKLRFRIAIGLLIGEQPAHSREKGAVPIRISQTDARPLIDIQALV
jgi:hypothetical protein